MVFPVVMYICESWTIKKAECQRIDAFELWCWKTLLRVPWTARRSNQSILKISPEYSLDAEAKTPIFWSPVVKTQLIGKDPDARKDWGQGEKGRTEDEMVGWYHQVNWHEFEPTPGDCKDREAWRVTFHGVANSQTRLSDWTATTWLLLYPSQQLHLLFYLQ